LRRIAHGGREPALQQHGARHYKWQDVERRKKWNHPLEEVLGLAEIRNPEEGREAQLDRAAEHREEGDEDGNLDQHRQAARHRIDLVLAVERHGLLLHLLRIVLELGLNLLELGLQHLHALHALVALAGQRPEKHPHQNGKQDDGNAIVGDEFVEEVEPTDLGADIIAGSLIKNPGGGIAPTGGYIAGKECYIKQISYRLTAPGIGMEVGSYSYGHRLYYQGLFLAPSTVKNAIKGNILGSYIFNKLGFDTQPKAATIPKDIILGIKFHTAKELVSFCQNVQKASPVDGYVTPEPWEMPGYVHKVIMAAGTFVQGASLELTADGAVRQPYVAYLQGGLTYEHYKIALEELLADLI